MLELNAKPFIGAAVELRQIHNLIDQLGDNKSQLVKPEDILEYLLPRIKAVIVELSALRANSPLASARRVLETLEIAKAEVTYVQLQHAIRDIELRFSDHLDHIRLFALNEQEAPLFEPAQNLLAIGSEPESGFVEAFPNASFEIEEAAKCIALGRYTASVFHSMRTLECGIKAFAKLLDIPDPIKPAQRNWAIMLNRISEALDLGYPKNTRLPHSDGSKLEVLFSHLEAVRNPWRNAVMHVESVYAPHEAAHIARCTGYFMLALAAHCDEQGTKNLTSQPNTA